MQESLSPRDRLEDTDVWLVACLFLLGGHPGLGVTSTLVRAGVELVRADGALAIEGWPVTGERDAGAFVGRDKVFTDLGFHRVARPTPDRSIMRVELRGCEVDAMRS